MKIRKEQDNNANKVCGSLKRMGKKLGGKDRVKNNAKGKRKKNEEKDFRID